MTTGDLGHVIAMPTEDVVGLSEDQAVVDPRVIYVVSQNGSEV